MAMSFNGTQKMNPADIKNGFDPKDLRQALGRFGTGVTVITTRAPDGRRVGVTANSFNTVSLEPPIVLWSLSIASPNLHAFRAAGHFVVNVLTLEQIDLSLRFSRPSEDRFAGVAFSEGLAGVPVLTGCAATIECTVHSAQVVGDHVLFLGKVERYSYAHAAPLLVFNGQYIRGADLMAVAVTPACHALASHASHASPASHKPHTTH
jgi:flavin reductase (DIM6/NTAB) family NADH-FMN oxidoreductase RutF